MIHLDGNMIKGIRHIRAYSVEVKEFQALVGVFWVFFRVMIGTYNNAQFCTTTRHVASYE